MTLSLAEELDLLRLTTGTGIEVSAEFSSSLVEDMMFDLELTVSSPVLFD